MPLSDGTRLGPYEVVALIGKGGMGEVYRARDTKLERDVAIKVLPDELANDDERVARFEREAKLLASLNHPNIASVHGFEESDGVKALVLELVEGPTLAERLEQGPIPVDEAIAIARQIAEALEAGHEAGVIHRDLKPANIKLKEDGTVKVLDYGLAKALEGDAPVTGASELSQSPTLTRQGTQVGVILGTAAYMSPEQAKGRLVDKRTDIWAFGAVVYEMLTGRRAFGGEDISDTLAAVLRDEPDWGRLHAPARLQQLLRLCLQKDVKQRARDIGDVRLAMSGAFDLAAAPSPAGKSRSTATTLGAVLLLSAIVGVAVRSLTPEVPRPVARFSVSLPPGESLTSRNEQIVAISPDGSRLAYSANDRLYLRTMDQLEAAPLEGTDGARGPFFSPDGEWVGFYGNGYLSKVAIRGGAPVNLCEAEYVMGASWGADDTIVYAQEKTGIMWVSAEGGTAEVLIPLAEADEVGHYPQVLPDGKAVLFTVGDGTSWDEAEIVAHSLQTGERKVLIEAGKHARYVATGHLVYVSSETLFAVPFDVDTLEVTTGPITMVEGVRTADWNRRAAAHFSISDAGSLVYLPTSADVQQYRTLVWVDRDGREEALSAVPRAYIYPSISPDGERLAVMAASETNDIWLWDFARETLSRFTFAPGVEVSPVWTPDGKRMVFASDRDGGYDLYWKAADGRGAVERLLELEHDQYPDSFTPDGRQLVFESGPGADDLAVLSLDGSSEPLLATAAVEANGQVSPDGRWLVYQSDVSGQDEIYLRPFPNVEDGQWQISSGGGTRPHWSPDGRELFYIVPPDARFMAIPVQTEPSFAAGNAEELFSGYFAPSGGLSGHTYDVSPDGERFLMIKESEISAEFVLVQNWFEELKRLVPTND